jgi:hypothetical protein
VEIKSKEKKRKKRRSHWCQTGQLLTTCAASSHKGYQDDSNAFAEGDVWSSDDLARTNTIFFNNIYI